MMLLKYWDQLSIGESSAALTKFSIIYLEHRVTQNCICFINDLKWRLRKTHLRNTGSDKITILNCHQDKYNFLRTRPSSVLRWPYIRNHLIKSNNIYVYHRLIKASTRAIN